MTPTGSNKETSIIHHSHNALFRALCSLFMLLKTILNTAIPSLRPQDSVAKALDLMEHNRMPQLPIVDKGELVSMADEFRLEAYDENSPLADVIHFETPLLRGDQHLFEVLPILNDNLEVLPVLDENNVFLGSFTAKDALQAFSKIMGMQEVGAIIVIVINAQDYSLAEISRLVESNNCKILSSNIAGQLHDPLNPLTLTLKLNKEDITAVVATLQRFGYEIEAAFAHKPIQNSEQERYDLLMKYLNI